MEYGSKQKQNGGGRVSGARKSIYIYTLHYWGLEMECRRNALC